MFARLLLCFFLALPFLSFSQQKKYMYFDANWEVARSEELVLYSCECYTDEQGQFVGRFTCYNELENVLVKDYNFKMDRLHGSVQEFFDDGTLKLQASYFEGMPTGEWKEFDVTGSLVLHRTFNEKSELVRDYFQEQTPYDKAVSGAIVKEEPPIYTTACIRMKIASQKYVCSEQALQDYFSNAPIPEVLKQDPIYAGKDFVCLIVYTINRKGIVVEAEIVQSTGDAFLDQLAQAHILNMVPFEAAKEYGQPVSYKQDAQIVFKF